MDPIPAIEIDRYEHDDREQAQTLWAQGFCRNRSTIRPFLVNGPHSTYAVRLGYGHLVLYRSERPNAE